MTVPAVLPKVAGDAERTRQVLTNLLDNAIKYSPQGGRIELGVEADEAAMRASSSATRGSAFRSASRNGSSRSSTASIRTTGAASAGSGLGLYICRELVRSMDGRIWVDSDPGKGSTFTFELPVAHRVAAPA